MIPYYVFKTRRKKRPGSPCPQPPSPHHGKSFLREETECEWGCRGAGAPGWAGGGQRGADAVPGAEHRPPPALAAQPALWNGKTKIKQPGNQPVAKIDTVVTFGTQDRMFTNKCIGLGLRENCWTRLTPNIATCAATTKRLCIQTCMCASTLVLRSLSPCSAGPSCPPPSMMNHFCTLGD